MARANIAERTNTIAPAEYLRMVAELVTAERDIRAATENAAAARGRKAGILKRAKNAGADVDAMKLLVDLKKLDDDERNHLIENVVTYAGWEGIAIWRAPTPQQPQGALFADNPDAQAAAREVAEARVYNEGWTARLAGKAVDEGPFKPGDDLHQTWVDAWKDCDLDLAGKPPVPAAAAKASTARKPAKAAAAAPAEPDAPKRGRGRPKKVTAAAATTEAEESRDEQEGSQREADEVALVESAEAYIPGAHRHLN